MTMESLRRAGLHSRNQNLKQQEAIKFAREALINADVFDPGPSVEEQTALLNDALAKSIKELKKNHFSPEANTNYWRAKLQADGKRMGLDISVPDCNWTEEEIGRPMKDKEGKEVPSMMVYLPDELMGSKGLVRLGQMYPEMGSWSIQEGTIVRDSPNANKKGGWFKVEATIDAPNLNTTLEDLRKHAEKQGYSGMRERTYILASQASKDLRGRYLDERWTWSRLLGSRYWGGGVVKSHFLPSGALHTFCPPFSWSRSAHFGGCFEEAKKI